MTKPQLNKKKFGIFVQSPKTHIKALLDSLWIRWFSIQDALVFMRISTQNNKSH